jgi:hypothetical protein
MVTASHGSLGEEAVRLAAAVQDWLQSASGNQPHGSQPHGSEPGSEPGSGTPAECLVCPACQLLRLVRGTRPEVYGHLADAAASLSAALREMTADRTPDAERRGNVEHIDLG